MAEYVLGANDRELERLRFQHEVWGGTTRALCERAGLAPGMRVLDLGSGPGLVTEDLRERVGERGAVLALDASAHWQLALAERITERGWQNVRHVEARIEEARLEGESFDFVFARWVFSFLPDPAAALAAVAQALAPGGVLAIQDYDHDGVGLFPASAGFDAMVRATRELYTRAGGDPWIAPRLPGLARRVGLEPFELTPHAIAGGPSSPGFRWADTFFPVFSETFVEQGLASEAERRLFLEEWEERKRDPDSVFVSPLVVDFLARRPLGPSADRQSEEAASSAPKVASAESQSAPRS